MDPLTIAVLALCSACAVASTAVSLVASRRPPEVRPAPDADERLERLERALPEWQLAMAGLVDQAQEFFERAERKRSRAAADVSRSKGPRADGEPQLELVRPHDPIAAREQVKRDVAARLEAQGQRFGRTW